MSIIEAIKNSVLEQFEQSVTVEMILLSLVTAFVIALLIIVVYRLTYSGVVYSKNTALTIVLLTMVTAMIIRTINSNLSLSLGMVGALSIVRFRTAIKDSIDTAFLFWGITGGIMAGAGLYFIGIAASIAVGILYYVIFISNAKGKNKFLLVINYDLLTEDNVKNAISEIKNCKFKSKTVGSNNNCEVTYEVVYDKNTEHVATNIKNIGGVKNVSIISYTNNDFGA